jgi:hypothetical protein
MKQVIYILILILTIVACEEIYNPKIDEVDNMLVVEAILRVDQQLNTINLYRSRGFNNTDESYPRVAGATVYLTDDDGGTLNFTEFTPGVYIINQYLDTDRMYTLNIDLNGEHYISEAQQVPAAPLLDSVYGEYATKVSVEGTANSSEDIVKEYGIQLQTDIMEQTDVNHYRFYGRKVIQYLDTYDTVIMGMPETRPIYIWKSVRPGGIFNIAGPPAYSTSRDIIKHPLEFFEQNYFKYMPDTMSFMGWIYIIDEFGINENSYNFYTDLNRQLGTEGRIFDPVYVQLEGNLHCESDPDKIVLGNFEITSYSESRYYLFWYKGRDEFNLKKINYFYDIPSRGYVKDDKPEFWENMSKTYPDE